MSFRLTRRHTALDIQIAKIQGCFMGASGSQGRPKGHDLDIEGWLRTLGLEQHAQTFRDNAIDAEVVGDLTDDHLRELGLPLGARLKILRAAATVVGGERPPNAPEIRRVGSRSEAERRQLTVMFCDLVGSTSLAARLDPEDMREIIEAYYRCCADLIARAGGYVAQYLGDGVLAYFGYPEAHEHDQERAVRAGLALVEEVPKLATAAKAPLQVRIGVATGLVVVGDLVGQERGIVGDTPNLAARLQTIAEPNTVVIADNTRRLLGNLFELRDLGIRNDLKGIVGSTRAWVAMRASSVGSRFDALHTTDLTAMVGREEESELLLHCWSRAKTGEGQVVLLSGEAGIGKSRLTVALAQRLSAEPVASLRYSARHTEWTARCTRSSIIWNAAPVSHTTTTRASSSTSLTRYWPRPRPRPRILRFLRKCCRSRMMGATPSPSFPRTNAGKERWKCLCRKSLERRSKRC